MKDSRRQNVIFVALALMVQTFMWLAFTFFDYGFDEKNILDNSDLEDWVGICLIAWLFVFPVFIYFRLRKKYLLTDHPVRDGILRILCWGALCLFISCPIVWAVENDVWIGSGVFIKAGVKIGSGAIIGANAVVTHDVEPYSIVAGVPAKEIRKRLDNETIERLLELKWWDWPDDKIRKYAEFFSDPVKLLSAIDPDKA